MLERGVHINKFLSSVSLGSQIEKPLQADRKVEPKELLIDDVVIAEEVKTESLNKIDEG